MDKGANSSIGTWQGIQLCVCLWRCDCLNDHWVCVRAAVERESGRPDGMFSHALGEFIHPSLRWAHIHANTHLGAVSCISYSMPKQLGNYTEADLRGGSSSCVGNQLKCILCLMRLQQIWCRSCSALDESSVCWFISYVLGLMWKLLIIGTDRKMLA